jgi:hypothetical protein
MAAVVHFEVLYQRETGWTEEFHEKRQSFAGKLVKIRTVDLPNTRVSVTAKLAFYYR